MRPIRRLVVLLTLFCLCGVGLSSGWTAEPSPYLDESARLTRPETIRAKIKEIEQTVTLDEVTKKQVLDMYHKSLDNLGAAESQNNLTQKHVQTIETASAAMQRLAEKTKREQDPAATDPADAISQTATLKEIEQQLLKAKTDAIAQEGVVAGLVRQCAYYVERPLKISQRIATLEREQERLVTQLKTPSPASEAPFFNEAQQYLLETELEAVRSELRQLNQELVSMPMLVELTNAQRNEAEAHLETLRNLVQQLEATANRQRQEEAAFSVGQAKEALRQAAERSPIIQQVATKNAEIGDALQTALGRMVQLSQEREAVEKELKKVEENFNSAKIKIAVAGTSHAIGLMLHEHRQTLPHPDALRKKSARNGDLAAEAGLLRIRLTDERNQLDSLNDFIKQLTAGASIEEAASLKPELEHLLTSRRELLDRTIATNQMILGTLAEIEVLTHKLVTALDSFNRFLAERLLWIRSMPMMRLQDAHSLPDELAVLTSADNWRGVGSALVDRTRTSPIILLTMLATGILLAGTKKMHSQMVSVVHLARNPASYHFILPLQAMGLIVLIALPWPLLLFTIGWELNTLSDPTTFARAVSIGLLALSYRFLFLRIVRGLVKPQGLAANFFHWSKPVMALLHRTTGLLMVTFLPMIFLTQIAFFAVGHGSGNNILGRLCFLVSLVIILLFFYHILHPATGALHNLLRKHAQSAIARLYPLFYFAILLLPFVWAVLVVAGYVFTVGSLIRCIINSIWLAFGTVLCHQLIERWLIQSGRKITLQQTLLARSEARCANQPISSGQGPEKEPKEERRESAVELSLESRKLLNTLVTLGGCAGLWLIWADVLPALSILNEFVLWQTTTTINGQPTTIPVTLGDAGLTTLIAIVTLTATRHFPAVLKIILLQHLNISTGSRYTAITLSRYLIGGTGLLLIVDILGFSWSQVQWLIAALGVGIGFGLQEIVANFISGLIILFERPIRVGDVVTVGSTDGTVTRIRIRATTIRDFDGKELLVPNKEFISGHLLNWSLSDPIIRILVPVGIAYGSDVQTAMNLMTEAARENELVLDHPAPAVTFDSFGDNALLLTLRCHIGSVDVRVTAKSQLHQAIDSKFRAAGITMAFPQRDVHLDTNSPLDIRIVGGEDQVHPPKSGEEPVPPPPQRLSAAQP